LEPRSVIAGVNPTTALARDANAFMGFMAKFIIPLLVPLLMPFVKVLSTPKRAARMITKVLINASGQTGFYFDEDGHPMLGSALVRDPKFAERVVAETRALLWRKSEELTAVEYGLPRQKMPQAMTRIDKGNCVNGRWRCL